LYNTNALNIDLSLVFIGIFLIKKEGDLQRKKMEPSTIVLIIIVQNMMRIVEFAVMGMSKLYFVNALNMYSL
jgi:hypothetical protein